MEVFWGRDGYRTWGEHLRKKSQYNLLQIDRQTIHYKYISPLDGKNKHVLLHFWEPLRKIVKPMIRLKGIMSTPSAVDWWICTNWWVFTGTHVSVFGGSGRDGELLFFQVQPEYVFMFLPFSIHNMMCGWEVQRCRRHRLHPFCFLCSSRTKQSQARSMKMKGWVVRAGCKPPLDDVLSSWPAPLDELLGSQSRFTCNVAGVSLSVPYKDTLPKPSILNMRDASRMKMSWGKKSHRGWKQGRASTSADGSKLHFLKVNMGSKVIPFCCALQR